YKRAVVYVDLKTRRASHSYTASTFVYKEDRGKPQTAFALAAVEPQPKFAFPNVAPTCAATWNTPGCAVVAFTITNGGLNDIYDLTMTAPNFSPTQPTWQSSLNLYRDEDGDQKLNTLTDFKLTNPTYDINGNGVVDTGELGTGRVPTIFAAWAI